MYNGKKVVVVMPAYNAASTVRQTYAEVRAQGLVDLIILVDDRSRDQTAAIARTLEGVQVHVHEKNLGYGGNQKTCYRLAVEAGADIVIMIHPDYQYTPKLLPAMVSMIGNGLHPCVLGSRILGGYAVKGGMPPWKYIANRGLTICENIALGQNLGDFHSGFRAYRRQVIETIPFECNSDDFVFDSQFLAQAVSFGFKLGDIPVPVRYFDEASSINFGRSVTYGTRTLAVLAQFWLHRSRLWRSPLFEPKTGQSA